MKELQCYTITYKEGEEKKFINVAAASYREAAFMAEEFVDEDKGNVLINIIRRKHNIIVPEL